MGRRRTCTIIPMNSQPAWTLAAVDLANPATRCTQTSSAGYSKTRSNVDQENIKTEIHKDHLAAPSMAVCVRGPFTGPIVEEWLEQWSLCMLCLMFLDLHLTRLWIAAGGCFGCIFVGWVGEVYAASVPCSWLSHWNNRCKCVFCHDSHSYSNWIPWAVLMCVPKTLPCSSSSLRHGVVICLKVLG